MDPELAKQLIGQLAVTSASGHQDTLHFSSATARFQTEQLLGLGIFPSNALEATSYGNHNAALLRMSQPPVQPPVTGNTIV